MINNFEIIGYLGSIALLISMLMTSVVRLRVINTIGCFLFIVYSLAIKSYPVAILNICIAVVNIVYIYKFKHLSTSFKVLNINYNDVLLQPFIEYHLKDIQKMFPEYTYTQKVYPCSFVIIRNMDIAGVFMASDEGNGNLFVELDYVIPAYRDCKVGNFLFNEQRELFLQNNYKKIVTISGNNYHSKYLQKVGFKEVSSEAGIKTFELEL